MSHEEEFPQPGTPEYEKWQSDLDYVTNWFGIRNKQLGETIQRWVETYVTKQLDTFEQKMYERMAEFLAHGLTVHEGQHHPMTGPDGQMDAHSYQALVGAIGEEIDRMFVEHREREHVAGVLSDLVDAAVAERFEHYSDIFTGLHRFERVEANLEAIHHTVLHHVLPVVSEQLVEMEHRLRKEWSAHDLDAIDAEIEALETGEEGQATA